ncbi:MAG: carbohydrate ABC transporter permease, partial [Bifidobacterium psychraerophilum]
MKQSVSVRTAGNVVLALTIIFSVLPFLSMLSAALQPQGSMPEGIQFTAHPQWSNFVDAWNMADITPLLWSSTLLVIVVV